MHLCCLILSLRRFASVLGTLFFGFFSTFLDVQGVEKSQIEKDEADSNHNVRYQGLLPPRL